MIMLRHKIYGEGEVIKRDDEHITIRFYNDGSDKHFKFPESFTLGLFEMDESFRMEVDAAVLAKKEAERAKREAWVAQSNQILEQNLYQARPGGTRRSGNLFVKTVRTGDMEKDFETFMIKNKYSKKGISGKRSTVYSYIYAIKLIMKDEGIDWDLLPKQISKIAATYDIGGKKEDIGYKGKRTVINALRRFEDFLHNSVPAQNTISNTI